MDSHECAGQHAFTETEDEYRNRVIYCIRCGDIRPLCLTVQAEPEDGFSEN